MSLHSININNTDTNKRKRDVNIAKDQLNDLSSQIVELCKNKDNSVEPRSVSDHIQSMVMNFLSSLPNDFDQAVEHLELIISSSVPKDLVMLYLNQNYRMIAYTSIREFISSFKNDPLKPIYAFIALKFCKILRENVKTDDGLYRICRSSLGAMIEFTGIARCKYEQKKLVSLNSVFPFLMEISAELSLDLESTMGTSGFEGLSFTLVRDFSAFLLPVWNVLWSMDNVTYEEKFFEKIDLPLYEMFYDLLAKVTLSLRLLDSKKVKKDIVVPWWSLYLDILNDLQSISKLYIYMEDDFWQNMKQVKGSLCYLITNFAEKSEHYEWIFEHKEVTNFYIRRQLAMMMLPEVEDNVEDKYNMLIDRSKLIVDSFDYITKLKYLPGSFFVQFKEEQAIGPGVLREWFLLACQEIFNPNNALFVACPDDNRSFFPNQGNLSLHLFIIAQI
nr:E3 ubiquitin-protein ligase UPL5-like [Solanum lycopersicum]